MKKLLLFVLAATAFAACSTDTTQDLAPEIPTAPDELQVSFDEEDTRIQLGDACRPVWTKGDLVSVFYRSNANSKYQFTGETGDANGSIKLVEEGVATQQTTQIVAVYPYNENYWFNWNTGDVEASLPAEQTYLKDSFGVGSSLMVSSNVFTQLSFKNVCGWLKLQFTGTGYVSKIVLKGNNGEQVAGKIYVNTSDASSTLASTMGESGDDIIESRVGGFIEEEGAILTEITLNCGNGVALNSETPTAFYIALPPQTFEKGFTATMYGCDGSTKEISTENLITIERNHILPMASVTLEMPITDNVIWYTSSDGNVIEPNATDVFGANITSNTYENGVGIITFDGDVTMIGDKAFYGCTALTSVTIPDNVTTIGNYAFDSCSSLTSVTIPDSVTTIGEVAFYVCTSLTSVTIPDSVTTIGYGAFGICSKLTAFYGKFASADNRCLIVDGVLNSFAPAGLTEYTIPDSVTTIGDHAFYGCSSLTSVIIGNSVTTIGDWAFTYCDALTSITIPDSVRTIGYAAFHYCTSLTSVTIPDSVTTIGSAAFHYCTSLTSVTIPDSVTTIGEGAFGYCTSLTSVTIPDSVTTIGNYAFEHCYALKAFYGKFASADNRCLIVDGVLNSFAPAGLTTYSIPNSVTTIGGYAFDNCRALTSVTIPDSVTTIGNYAFEHCYALKEVYCKPTTPPIAYKGSGAYWKAFDDNASDRKIYVPTASVDAYKAADGWKEYADAIVAMPIPKNQIWYTSSDGNVIEPDKTDVFGANITSNTYENGVGVITFDGDVTKIGEFAFYNCTSLTSVTIPDSVTTIGEGAFGGCDALKAFYGKFASADNRCLIVDGVLNSFAPAGLTTYSIPNSVTKIGEFAFYNCRALTSVTIPDSVTTIGDHAFYSCTALTSVTIGNSVTKIGNYAFWNCTALTSVTIPDSVTTIEGCAFYNCDALTSVTIPDSVTTIGENAFRDCDALKSVTIPDSVTTIGVSAFASCDALKAFYGKYASADNRCLIVDGVLNSFAPAGLTTYSIPDNVTEIGNSAFYSCDALTSVTIPDSVTTIGVDAFRDCRALTSVTIGNSVTTIEGSAFYRCTALKEVYCKPTTPPSLGGSSVFDNNASDRKIYVPTASVDAYKAASRWSEYASAIYPYTFTE